MSELTKREQVALTLLAELYRELVADIRAEKYGWPIDWGDGICRDAFKLADIFLAESARTESPEPYRNACHECGYVFIVPNEPHKCVARTEPKQDGDWIEWGGGDCPVPEGTIVDVRYRNGRERFDLPAMEQCAGCDDDASDDYWHDDDQYNDIVAYRVVKP